ncbi:MAG: hypothetical protein IJY27_01250 [Clostridia bacterium]|nr:hypothetical protein [Clostridia bacterium]
MASLNAESPTLTQPCKRTYELIIFRADASVDIITATPECNHSRAGRSLLLYEPLARQIYRSVTEEYIQYPRMPILITNGNQNFAVIRSMARAAGFYVMVQGDGGALDAERLSSDTIFGVVDLSTNGEYWAREIKPPAVTESAITPKNNDEFTSEKWLSSLIGKFYYPAPLTDGVINTVLLCTETAAELVGCRLEVGELDDIPSSTKNKLDTDVLAAFMLLLSILFQRESQTREARLDIKSASGSLVVQLSSRLYRESKILKQGIVGCPELGECRHIADRYNMMFDCLLTPDGVLSVRFCPVRREWSHLGIKTTPKLKY